MDSLHALLAPLGIADPLGRGFLSVVLTFITAWVFTWLFIPRLRAFAVQAGWADMPNARRLNSVTQRRRPCSTFCHPGPSKG